MLGRDTPWRQGSLIAQAVAIAAGLFDESSASHKRTIVITHDCDLPNEKETQVEVMVCEVIDKVDQNFGRARNVRRLHLAFEQQSGEELFLELQMTSKQWISKSLIAGDAKPDGDWLISDDEKRALKQWLAARYGRPAFPNAFENHLRKKTGKYSVEQQLSNELEKVSSYLVGVFFDLGETRAVEITNGIPYDLKIIVVYDASEGGQPARLAAEEVASEIRDIFRAAYGPPESATQIALENCEAVADTFFPLSGLRKVDQWRVEFISLRQDPSEVFFAVGELPV